MIEQQTLVSDAPKNAPAMSPRRRFMAAMVPGALLALTALIVYALLHKNPHPAQAGLNEWATPNIKTATLHRGNIGEYIEAIGTVTPLATVNLYSQVNGQVVAVHYVEGQIVHRGVRGGHIR